MNFTPSSVILPSAFAASTLVAVKVTLKGLKGGHSGIEINEGRANANKCMVRFVREAISELDARLASWQGGNMRNAIPFQAEVVLTLPKENIEALNDLREQPVPYRLCRSGLCKPSIRVPECRS